MTEPHWWVTSAPAFLISLAYRAPLVGHQRAGVLDQFGVAVFQAHGLGQQFNQPCIHAGEHGQVFVWKLVGLELFVLACFHEGAVMFQQGIQQSHRVLLVAAGGSRGCVAAGRG